MVKYSLRAVIGRNERATIHHGVSDSTNFIIHAKVCFLLKKYSMYFILLFFCLSDRTENFKDRAMPILFIGMMLKDFFFSFTKTK